MRQRPKMCMRDEIETALRPLMGEPLSHMRRAGFQMFEIGVQRPCKNRKGQDITLADMSLHVSCNWYITRNGDQIVSSEDFGPGWGVRRDEKAMPFYEMLGEEEFVVTSIHADNSGGVVIQLTRGYMLQIVTDHDEAVMDTDADTEQWRLLPKDRTRRDFVVTAEGIQRY